MSITCTPPDINSYAPTAAATATATALASAAAAAAATHASVSVSAAAAAATAAYFSKELNIDSAACCEWAAEVGAEDIFQSPLEHLCCC